jgi:hypothetical protein
MFQNQYFPRPWHKFHNIPLAHSLSVILVLHHQPLPVMSEMGPHFLQIMSTAHTQPLPIMLGAPSYSPQIIAVSHLQPLFIMKENILFPLPVMTEPITSHRKQCWGHREA